MYDLLYEHSDRSHGGKLILIPEAFYFYFIITDNVENFLYPHGILRRINTGTRSEFRPSKLEFEREQPIFFQFFFLKKRENFQR